MPTDAITAAGAAGDLRTTRPPRRAILRAAAAGAAVGAAWGVVARYWMRLVSDDPGFSWTGTIFIVLAFTLNGLGAGLAAGARARQSRRGTTTARIGGGVLSLGLFMAAGGVMFPTVLFASLAAHRRRWHVVVRVVFALLALVVPVLLLANEGGRLLELRVAAGFVLMAATYASIVRRLGAVVRPLPRRDAGLTGGHREPRWSRRRRGATVAGCGSSPSGICAGVAAGSSSLSSLPGSPSR